MSDDVLQAATDGAPGGPHEEFANALTHGVGLVLSLAGGVAIAVAPRPVDIALAVGLGVYAVTLVVMYTFSMLSHAVHRPGPRHLLRAWDQGWIYFLIAGTYTPILLAYIGDPLRWVILGAVWIAAVAGFYSKVFAKHRVNSMLTHSYILLGWLPALVMMKFVSFDCLIWLAAGGVLYTVGTLFLMLDGKRPYFHAAWHLMVILASACHYYAIVTFVMLANSVA